MVKEKIRAAGTRGKAAGVLALAGAALLGYVAMQPAGQAEVPGWEPVNSQVMEALDEAAPKPSAQPAGAAAPPGAGMGAGAEGGHGAGEADGQAAKGADGQSAGSAGKPAAGAAGEAAAGTASGPAAAPGSGQATSPAGESEPDAPVPASPSPDSAPAAADSTGSGRLNLNAATAEQLDELKGIGPSKAKAIVEYRELHGPFRSVDDLLNVKGIGEKLLDGIRDAVTV